MANEYLKWKYRDVKPDAPVELTPRQRRQNWWHYYKWYVLLALLLLGIGASLLKSALHIGEILPDAQIAYVGESMLPEGTVQALEAALAAYGEDVNGDGRVKITLNQYVQPRNQEDSSYAAAAQIRLMADLEGGESGLFLLQDYETFQTNYDILAPSPALWSDCPALTGLDLGEYRENVAGETLAGHSQALLEPLWAARRGEWREAEDGAVYDRLWDAITKGAQ